MSGNNTNGNCCMKFNKLIHLELIEAQMEGNVGIVFSSCLPIDAMLLRSSSEIL